MQQEPFRKKKEETPHERHDSARDSVKFRRAISGVSKVKSDRLVAPISRASGPKR
jgi:hypothetical protein